MVLTKKEPPIKSEASTAFPSPAQFDAKEKTKAKLTRIVIQCDVGFNNSMFIRGNGPNLSWDKGIMLHNTQADEWVWETDQPFDSCEFKVLINDSHYEQGDNRKLTCENCVKYTPTF